MPQNIAPRHGADWMTADFPVGLQPNRRTHMTNKVANETVYDAVVIKTWLIPGPSGDVDHPQWLASYAVQGAPAVVMTGEGMESHEEAALAAVEAVAAYLKAQISRFPSAEGSAR